MAVAEVIEKNEEVMLDFETLPLRVFNRDITWNKALICWWKYILHFQAGEIFNA